MLLACRPDTAERRMRVSTRASRRTCSSPRGGGAHRARSRPQVSVGAYAPLTTASDDLRAHRSRSGMRPLAPGKAEARAAPRPRLPARPERELGASGWMLPLLVGGGSEPRGGRSRGRRYGRRGPASRVGPMKAAVIRSLNARIVGWTLTSTCVLAVWRRRG